MACLDYNYYLFIFICKEHNPKYMFLLKKKKHPHLMLHNLELFFCPFVSHIPLQNLSQVQWCAPEHFSSLCAFLYFCLLSLLLCTTVFFLLNLGSNYLIIPFISYSCSFPYQQIYSPQSPQIIFYECKSNRVWTAA